MKKIVLVEDDEPIRDAFAMALSRGDYDIQMYASGDAILQKEIAEPDLFVLDRNISGLSGIDLCRFIKMDEAYKDVPVLIMSAFPGVVDAAEEAGAAGTIVKPFLLKTLRETIGQLV
jgi:DNA-binding response OmpR family regulator